MVTVITNYAGLVAIANDLAGSYELGNNISASGQSFTPLGTFTGTLDGKGFKITDLAITVTNSSHSKAAFITVNQGTVQNLDLVDCVIAATSTGNGNSYAGGIAHENDGGTIQNCHTTGTITATTNASTETYWAAAGGIATWNENSGTITECSSTATISATSTDDVAAGGLVAFNMGTISESYATGDVTATSTKTYSATAIAHAGGFVALNGYTAWDDGAISDCYARGSATATGAVTNYAGGFVDDNQTAGSTIARGYSTGAPTGADGVGGFCRTDSGTISDCFWDTQTSGEASSDGGTGKTTAQMKTQSTFTDAGWNFTTIWSIHPDSNDGYPYLIGIGLVVIYPSDDVARVSSIRRAYRPGMYRMEIGLGELGFYVDVSEAAIKRIPDEIVEPEVPTERPEEPTERPAKEPTTDWRKMADEGIMNFTDLQRFLEARGPSIGPRPPVSEEFIPHPATAPFHIPITSLSAENKALVQEYWALGDRGVTNYIELQRLLYLRNTLQARGLLPK